MVALLITRLCSLSAVVAARVPAIYDLKSQAQSKDVDPPDKPDKPVGDDAA
jgi:hypothetical protein